MIKKSKPNHILIPFRNQKVLSVSKDKKRYIIPKQICKNFVSLVKKYDEVVQKILVLIDSKDNKELYEIPCYKKYPFGRMIQFNTSSPYKNARERIRAEEGKGFTLGV